MAAIGWLDLGLTDYQAAFAVQAELHRRRLAGRLPDVILFQENFPVITIGRALLAARGITLHGVALNVDPDLSCLGYIVPCGLKNRGVTSLAAQGAPTPPLAQVRDDFLREFARVFAVPLY